MWLYFIVINLSLIFVKYLSYFDYYYNNFFNGGSTPTSFDYIIVGSGSAGSILARRLAATDQENITVLLLEAGGGSPTTLFNIPSIGIMLQKTEYDWQYETVPQRDACLGLENQASVWPMGKIVGGTSMLNNMVYIRGHRDDFHDWYKNHQFDYKLDIEPYFKKLESWTNETDNYHKSSTIISPQPTFLSILSDKVLAAGELLGYSVFNDISVVHGFTVPRATISHGQRCTPSQHLPHFRNIALKTHALATKLLFKSNYECIGVEYNEFNKRQRTTAIASKAIILSAGVIGTPKLLMLSGIGPHDHLTSLGITPIVDLPVGDNLQDHIATGFDLVQFDAAQFQFGIEQMMSPHSMWQYFWNGSGPWTGIGCEAIGFFSSAATNDTSRRPDLQLMVLPVGVSADRGLYLRTLSGISDRSWREYFSRININNVTAVTFLPIVLHPKSRGTIRLRDTNIFSAPLIDPKYLSHPYDIRVIVEGIRLIQRLIRAEPLASMGARINPVPFPGCDSIQFDSNQYWECYVRHLTLTTYHPVGSCAMGIVTDYGFQVKKTNKLFIVDGSVLPSLTSGNVNAAIMMMAEKAADTIKNYDYLSRYCCSILEIFRPNMICFNK